MDGQTVLLRVMDVYEERWQWMALDEFLRRIRLNDWTDGQLRVGMILPPARHRKAQ